MKLQSIRSIGHSKWELPLFSLSALIDRKNQLTIQYTNFGLIQCIHHRDFDLIKIIITVCVCECVWDTDVVSKGILVQIREPTDSIASKTYLKRKSKHGMPVISLLSFSLAPSISMI